MQPDLTHLSDPIPVAIAVSFAAVTVLTMILFYRAVRSGSRATGFLVGSVLWLLILAWLAYEGFFLELDTFPPRLMLALVPALGLVFAVGLTPLGYPLTHQAGLAPLTWLHTIRFPVELLLYALYTQGQVSERMTFTGGNLDILTGLTAPLAVYVILVRGWLSLRWLLAWHIAAVGLLLNVVIPAALSFPSPFQSMSFDQPNVAVLKAPLIWLPGYVVPVVLLAHLVAIGKLLRARKLSSAQRSW